MEQLALEKIESNPASAAVYKKLVAELSGFASYEIENKKTSLHVTNGRAFLGVHPRKNGLLLNIVLARPLESTRLKKSEKVSANRYHHEIELGEAKDLDTELMGWVQEAYSLTS